MAVAKGSKAAKAPKASKAPKATSSTRKRKVKAEAGSVGLTAEECSGGAAPSELKSLLSTITSANGAVLAHYREPLGGNWVVFAALPIDCVEPTPYQRELSKTHADKLATVIPKVARFLDPVIAVVDDDNPGRFITPNGMHRLTAMKQLGAKSITALVIPEREIAFRILALNTEKAHTLRDKAMEVIRMARAVAAKGNRSEQDMAFELEQPGYITLGICYEHNGRFSGGAYQSVVSRCEEFFTSPLSTSLKVRESRAAKLLELDAAVGEAVVKLKESGFASGYLKPIVVARVNPIRFIKPGGDKPDFDKTIDKMIDGAKKFDASKVRAQDVALAAAIGGGEE